jgi:hypothetical protein
VSGKAHSPPGGYCDEHGYRISRFKPVGRNADDRSAWEELVT